MRLTHYDLFAGIGGFSLALERVFTDGTIRHIFCEWDSFCTAVLKKHWPEAECYGDIAELVADTDGQRQLQPQRSKQEIRQWPSDRSVDDLTIITGGFPCQPFSAAGRRKGTADDRYKWPEMFAVIRNVKPDWVIAENVRGLVTWNEGMVLEQVCTDLEAEGYEVQPLIIPAVAVNAPHRRDRVWIIANRSGTAGRVDKSNPSGQERQPTEFTQPEMVRSRDGEAITKGCEANSRAATTDSRPQRRQSRSSESIRPESQESIRSNSEYPDWSRDWQEVAFATCYDGVDDGLPRWVDGTTISAARCRKERLKAMGNAIVPQVAEQIFLAIKAYGCIN